MLNYVDKQAPYPLVFCSIFIICQRNIIYVHQWESNFAHIIHGKPSITEDEDTWITGKEVEEQFQHTQSNG